MHDITEIHFSVSKLLNRLTEQNFTNQLSFLSSDEQHKNAKQKTQQI